MATRTASLLVAASLLTSGALAQNDECTGAIALAVGANAFDTTTATLSPEPWPCGMGGAPDLWYSFTAANDATYTFDTCGSGYDTALELFVGSCAALQTMWCNDDDCTLQSSISWGMRPGDTVYIRVGGWNGAVGSGSINVAETPAPPITGSIAAWLTAVGVGTPAIYTNSDLASPIIDNIGAPNGSGGMTYEFVVHGDNTGASTALMGAVGPPLGDSAGFKYEQWPDTMSYGVTEFGVVDLSFPGGINSPGVDQHLVFVADVVAGTTTLYVDGAGFGSVTAAPVLQGEQGIGMIQRLASFNIDSMPFGRIRGVAVYEGMLTPGEIVAHRDAYFTGSLGTRYCDPSVPNSTGASSEMNASGSTTAADNLLTLECIAMPTNTFGFFLTSMTQGNIPGAGGSQGVLCLSGAIGRYVGPGQIQPTGGNGEITLPVDLTQHPTPTGLVSVLPGETWNFQAWYRDSVSGMSTSNFSDGLSITFQ